MDSQNWDKYWMKKENEPVLFVYDLIASFYRKFIIKPNLNNFIFKNFKKGDKLLHAGCGGGQVDIDISKNYKISALDISKIALDTYKNNNPNVEKLLYGDIFSVPANDSSFDGIYNLGVMEHFEEDEIISIMKEFKRIIKSEGKIIMFWPHESGPHVLFLKFAHFILRSIFKSKISLHPAEITRINSKKHIHNICKKANIEIENYFFSMRDLFTYVVIILSKNSSKDKSS